MALTLHGTRTDNTDVLIPESTVDRKTATPLVINGDMQIAQRGTSQTAGPADPYVADRFLCLVGAGSSSVFTVSQSTDVPTGQGFVKSQKWDVTTAQASLNSNSAVFQMHRIEGQNLQMFKKGTANAETYTVSFWVKSSKTGVHILQLRDNDNSRQQSQSYTIASANTWEKHVVNFVADTSGPFDNDSNASLDLIWWLSAGTDFSSGTLSTSWEDLTNANRAVGQVNIADSTDNNWYLTGVQLEVGTFNANTIQPFQFEDRATSLARCQRYCVVYGTGEESYQQLGETGISTSATQAQIPFNHPTEMRGVPSLSNSGNLALGQGTSLIAMTAVAINTNADTRQSTGVIATVASGLTAHKPYRIDQHNSSGSIMIFSAEI